MFLSMTTTTMWDKTMLLYAAVGLLVFSILWEHLARIQQIHARPTTLIRFVTNKCRSVFTWMGSWICFLSSFLVHLHLGEFGLTLWDLFEAITDLLFSVFYIARGYAQTAIRYNSTITIFLGTILLSFCIEYASVVYLNGYGSVWIALLTGILVVLACVYIPMMSIGSTTKRRMSTYEEVAAPTTVPANSVPTKSTSKEEEEEEVAPPSDVDKSHSLATEIAIVAPDVPKRVTRSSARSFANIE